MRNFWAVFKFEYLGYVTRKSFIGLTLAIVVLGAVAISWPRITGSGDAEDGAADISSIAGQPGGGQQDGGARLVALYSEDGNADAEYYNAAFAGMGYRFASVDSSESLEDDVSSAKYSDAVILHSDLSYTRVARNVGMTDYFDAAFSSAMLDRYRGALLAEHSVPEDAREQILGASVASETKLVESGKDQFSSFIFTYALIFALYMIILLYGQFVSTSVATEKSTRTMEILITSARPDVLMFGKVTGAGCAGLTQFAVILTSAVAAVRLNAGYYEGNVIIEAILGMPPSIFAYVFVFLILGFFIYAFLFAAFASLVSRIEEVSTTSMPVIFLFIIAFFVVMFSMASGSVDSPLMIAASYIPLSSPMAMFARIAMGDVRAVEIVISLVILVASTIGVGYLAAGIYRLGALLYGVPPKPREIIRMLRAQK